MFQERVVEKIKTHFMSNNFFSENRTVNEVMSKKYGTNGQATDDNTAHALCILDN